MNYKDKRSPSLCLSIKITMKVFPRLNLTFVFHSYYSTLLTSFIIDNKQVIVQTYNKKYEQNDINKILPSRS